MPKRDNPATPTKQLRPGTPDTGILSSPVRKQDSKRLFTGETAMEEDGCSIPSQEELRKKRADERAAKKASLQKAIEKLQANKIQKGTRKQPIDIDDESTVAGGKTGKEKGERRRPRGRSVPPAERKGKGKGSNSRAASVDSFATNPSKASSDSLGSGSKRKPSPNARITPKGAKKTSKSTKFSDGIPDNEGKTASTKKQAKEKKRETYAEKATKSKKKTWGYSTVMEYKTRVGKCNDVQSEMYSRHATAFRIFQDYDSECAIGDHVNAKAEPLRSPAEFKFNRLMARICATTSWIGSQIGSGIRSKETNLEISTARSSSCPTNRHRIS